MRKSSISDSIQFREGSPVDIGRGDVPSIIRATAAVVADARPFRHVQRVGNVSRLFVSPVFDLTTMNRTGDQIGLLAVIDEDLSVLVVFVRLLPRFVLRMRCIRSNESRCLVL